MKRTYSASITIELDDADFNRVLENFENSLYEYLDDEYMVWSHLDNNTQESVIKAIFKDLAQKILNKDLT